VAKRLPYLSANLIISRWTPCHCRRARLRQPRHCWVVQEEAAAVMASAAYCMAAPALRQALVRKRTSASFYFRPP
jgi:hypothetical protein